MKTYIWKNWQIWIDRFTLNQKTRKIILRGLALPVMAGFIILAIEYSIFYPSPAKVEQKPEMIGAGENEAANAQNYNPIAFEPKIDKKYRERIELIEKLSGVDVRNREYLPIIDSAIKESDLNTALALTEIMWGISLKNQQINKIINKAIAMNQIEYAKSAVEKMWGKEEKNTQIKKISNAIVNK